MGVRYIRTNEVGKKMKKKPYNFLCMPFGAYI